MALTFSVNGTLFKDLTTGDGEMARGWNVTAMPGFIRYHVPGTDGNLKTYLGFHGYEIQVACIYFAGSTAGVHAAYETFMNAWQGKEITIVSPGGDKYTRCELIPGSMNITSQAHATDGCGDGSSKIEFTASFTCDAGPNGGST